MRIQVTSLADNYVERGDGLLAEHGFCLLVSARGRKTLLDTGQTGICLSNAARLGIDLGDLRTVVLTHGHYDHCGGLPSVLERVGPAEVLAHPAAFAPKYARRSGGRDRYIGLPYDKEELTRKGARLRLTPQPQEIGPHLLSTGIVPRAAAFEDSDSSLWIKTHGKWEPDRIDEDQALVVRTMEGLVVLLGCAHAGVINTLRHAMSLTGDDRIRAVIGGLHLASASPERIGRTIAALQEMEVGQVVACHCTGFAARMRLHAALGERFVNGAVGLRLTF